MREVLPSQCLNRESASPKKPLPGFCTPFNRARVHARIVQPGRPAMSQHIVHFHCQIDQSTTERFRDCCLEAMDQGASSLLLNLSTTGGSTNFGFTLYTFLKSLPVPISAFNAGNIESMGVVMFLAASERVAAPYSRFLIHPMTWYFSQNSVDHSRLREYLSSLNNDLERYVRIF